MMKLYIENKEVSQLVEGVTWSGSESGVARKLEVNIINSDKDYYIPKIPLRLGQPLILTTDDGKELFQGFVLNKSIDAQNAVLSLTAYDGLYYLLQSEGIYNFAKKTAENIAQIICVDMQIAIGEVVPTGIVQNFPANGTLYEIIKEAYDFATSMTGKKYKIFMRSGKLYVEQKGQTAISYVLSENENISASGYAESAENLVNKIQIYDESGRQIGEVSDGSSIAKYGLFQKPYIVEENKDSKTVAQNMLEGVQQIGSIEGIGNTDCITGNRVTVHDSITGLKGSFLIISDSHTFSGGQHTMSLELEFDKVGN